MVVRSSQLGSRFVAYSFKHRKHVYYLFDIFINYKFHVCLCVCFGFALLNISLEALDYTAGNKTLVIVWRQCFFIKQLFIVNPVKSNLQVCLHVKGKILADHWARTNYLCYNKPMPQPLCYRYK